MLPPGTRPAFGSSFQLEMAQEGFSALLTPEGAVLGAVGAYDWAGGVFIYGADGKVAFVNASEGEGGVSDAYLGESLGVLRSSGGSLGWWLSPRGSWQPHAGLLVKGVPMGILGVLKMVVGVVGYPWGSWNRWVSPLESRR